MSSKTYSIVFVCDAGRVEIESLFLAFSLKKYLQTPAEIIVATPSIQDLSPATLKYFEELAFRVEVFDNPLNHKCANLSRTEKLTNKIFALEVIPNADYGIFIDSDTVALENVSIELDSADVIAPRVGFPGGYLNGSCWDEIAKELSIQLPSERITFEDRDVQHSVPPAFNSGFIALSSKVRAEFISVWRNTYESLLALGVEQMQDFFIEQTAFTLAVHKLKLNYQFLDDLDFKKSLLHYVPGKFNRITSEPVASLLVKRCFEEYPVVNDILSDRAKKNLITSREFNILRNIQGIS